MNWSETSIARALARQTFGRQHLVVVPNCTWTGHECDLLVVTANLRIIDVEIKISRADLKADAKKDKWWHRVTWRQSEAGVQATLREWPRKVWKHYYCVPEEVWAPELLACLPSPASGVILMREQTGRELAVTVERRATPCRDAETISPESAIDIARLASLRMWDTYAAIDQLRDDHKRIRAAEAPV